MGESTALCVAPGEAGQRLDRFLADRLELSRASVRRLLARGAVCVDGKAVSASAKGRNLDSGARVEIAPYERPENERAIADDQLELRVLAEGSGWIALDKPAGQPVHPLRVDETGTLLNALIARHPQVDGVGEAGLRSGVVHRLDVDTSGVVLFATDEPAWQRIRDGFREHRIEKIYRAIVVGELSGEGSAELGLVVARHRPARVRVVGEDEHARGVRVGELRWRSLARLNGATLVEVRPRTGFLHQIRVSLAHLGFPVVGDAAYGGTAIAAPRHMLHAASVRFEDIEAHCPDAADFASMLRELGGGDASE